MSFSMKRTLYFSFIPEKQCKLDTLTLTPQLHDMLGWQDRGPNSDHIADRKYSKNRKKLKRYKIYTYLYKYFGYVVVLFVKCCVIMYPFTKPQIKTHECNFLYRHINGQTRKSGHQIGPSVVKVCALCIHPASRSTRPPF